MMMAYAMPRSQGDPERSSVGGRKQLENRKPARTRISIALCPFDEPLRPLIILKIHAQKRCLSALRPWLME